MISYEYLAGLTDGDGCIGVYSTGKTSRKRVHLEIRMTCRLTVETLHKQFGGQFREQKTAEKHKRYWVWRVTDRKAILLLKEIQPYSITKKQTIHSILNNKSI